MTKLPDIKCRRCGDTVKSNEFTPTPKGGALYADSYESCLRKCEVCGLGFSNANTNRVEDLTRIYRDPFWNIPLSIAEGYQYTLENSLNVFNRRSKKIKFISSKSEDHVTWTVFRWLQIQGGLRYTLSKIGVEFASSDIGEPTLLLWGVPVPKENRPGKDLRVQLEYLLNEIGEKPDRLSEPDVILDFGARGLVIIEVKLWSKNDFKKSDYKGWDKYTASTGAFLNSKRARSSGLYELVRNWRIGCELAKNCPLVLVNLGPQSLFNDSLSNSMSKFRESIPQGPTRCFMKVTWQQFLPAISNQPEWFTGYVQDRGLI